MSCPENGHYGDIQEFHSYGQQKLNKQDKARHELCDKNHPALMKRGDIGDLRSFSICHQLLGTSFPFETDGAIGNNLSNDPVTFVATLIKETLKDKPATWGEIDRRVFSKVFSVVEPQKNDIRLGWQSLGSQ